MGIRMISFLLVQPVFIVARIAELWLHIGLYSAAEKEKTCAGISRSYTLAVFITYLQLPCCVYSMRHHRDFSEKGLLLLFVDMFTLLVSYVVHIVNMSDAPFGFGGERFHDNGRVKACVYLIPLALSGTVFFDATFMSFVFAFAFWFQSLSLLFQTCVTRKCCKIRHFTSKNMTRLVITYILKGASAILYAFMENVSKMLMCNCLLAGITCFVLLLDLFLLLSRLHREFEMTKLLDGKS